MIRRILYVSIFLLFTINGIFANYDYQINQGFLNKLRSYNPTSYFELQDYVEKIPDFNVVDINISTLECILSDQHKKLYHDRIQIFAYNRIGEILRSKNKISDAIVYHLKALKIANKSKDIEARIYTQNSLGICYAESSNLQEAMVYHKSSLKWSLDILKPNDQILKCRAISFYSVGRIYNQISQYNLAIQQFRDAIKIERKFNNYKNLAKNYMELANSNKQLSNFNGESKKLKEAEKNYNIALNFQKKANDKIGLIIIKERLADLYIDQGDYIKAKEIIQTFYYQALTSPEYYKFKANKALGKVQMKDNELKAAEINLEKAYKYFDKQEIKHIDFIEICKDLSELYELKKDYKKSLDYIRKAIDQEKKTSGKQRKLYVTNLINQYDVQTSRIRVKELQEEAALKNYETSKTRNILIITLITLALLGVALYSVYRQGLLNNDKKFLSLEQQALQAQMNPHFVFNALNSIKLYIINNEQRNAVYYLNKFAKLIRNILDTSRKREVSLAEELDTMDLYVTIENIRFNNDIVYNVDIKDDSLNLDLIRVPPLILQPFLENAIWHGLASKTKDKQVNLVIEKISDKMIQISIIDNGIGRKKAMDIKNSKTLKRKSVGIDLTQERLKTFASDYVSEASLKYIDLEDEQGNGLGTKVVLNIPIV